MAQVSTVLQGHPDDIKVALTALAASNEIQIVQKTMANGKYLVIYDNAGTAGQVIFDFKGAPSDLSTYINGLIASAYTIDEVAATFANSITLVIVR